MPATLRVLTVLIALMMPAAKASAEQPIADLPTPVRSYAEALKPYCDVIGKDKVVANRIYSDRLFGDIDINNDGLRDYIIYKCMFGCDGEPYAFQGLGPTCMFGSLLLSANSGYRSIPIPGQLSRFEASPRPRVVVYREHINKGDCGDAWHCTYVFELRDGWFRLVDVCPRQGCRAILSALRAGDKLRAANSETGNP